MELVKWNKSKAQVCNRTEMEWTEMGWNEMDGP